MWFILTSWIEMYQSLLTILATNHNTIPPTNRNADKSITSFVWISNHHLNLQMTSAQDVITHHQQSFAGLISPRQKKNQQQQQNDKQKQYIIWNNQFPYETSRSVYSLLQICYRCAGRSVDKLQIICRMSVEYLQNICRMSAERLQRRSATSLQVCRRSADEISLSC